MKKAILLISAVLITGITMAGGAKFQKKMGQTLGEYQNCNTVDDFQNLANQFSIISNVEKEEWLPLYYQAHCYILMSFVDTTGADKKDEYLQAANTSINKMMELAPNEAEAHTLHAFYYTAMLVVNPPERARKFGPLSAQAVGKALSLEPNNPRAQYINLSNEFGTARFFGNDISPFCKQAQEQLTNWDDYKLKSRIHPRWGKQQVEDIANACNK